MNIENIKEGINSRIDYYKKEREVIYKNKKSYKFTEEEQINGSKIYAKLLEKEKVFNIQIFELEYALVCVEYAKKKVKMEEIDKLIEKIENETFNIYTYEEVIEMLEDLKHSIITRNVE